MSYLIFKRRDFQKINIRKLTYEDKILFKKIHERREKEINRLAIAVFFLSIVIFFIFFILYNSAIR